MLVLLGFCTGGGGGIGGLSSLIFMAYQHLVGYLKPKHILDCQNNSFCLQVNIALVILLE